RLEQLQGNLVPGPKVAKGADVTSQGATGVSQPSAEEGPLANPAIGPHDTNDLADVRATDLAKVRHLIDEADGGREDGVARVPRDGLSSVTDRVEVGPVPSPDQGIDREIDELGPGETVGEAVGVAKPGRCQVPGDQVVEPGLVHERAACGKRPHGRGLCDAD